MREVYLHKAAWWRRALSVFVLFFHCPHTTMVWQREDDGQLSLLCLKCGHRREIE